jgi:hypothetical protein
MAAYAVKSGHHKSQAPRPLLAPVASLSAMQRSGRLRGERGHCATIAIRSRLTLSVDSPP